MLLIQGSPSYLRQGNTFRSQLLSSVCWETGCAHRWERQPHLLCIKMHSLRANLKHLRHTKTSPSNSIRMLWPQQFIFLFQMSPCSNTVFPYTNTKISQMIPVAFVSQSANPSLFYRKCLSIIPVGTTTIALSEMKA